MLEEIPYETFINILAPLLSMGDFGKLCLQSRYLNEIFSSNLVWKAYYLRSLHDKLKITSDSIHISSWRYKDMYRISSNPDEPCQLSSEIPGWQNRGGMIDDLTATLSRCPCVSPADFTGLRECGVTAYKGPSRYYDFYAWAKQDKIWLKQQRTKILEYNISQGRGGILCTNLSHYIQDTLEAPVSCRNLKSYRKAVISKLLTSSKHNVSKNNKVKRELEQMLKEQEVLKERIRSTTEKTEAADRKLSGLTTAMECKTI